MTRIVTWATGNFNCAPKSGSYLAKWLTRYRLCSYLVSKLLEAFAVREIAKKISAGTKPLVVINYPNPGFCESNIRKEKNLLMHVMEALLQRKTEYGSRNLVYAINAGEKSHGQYISNCHIESPPPMCEGEEGALLQQKVWNELAEKLEKVQPGIMSNL